MAGKGKSAKKPDKEPRMVTVKGRATKRRAFFERHTGGGAQVLAAAVLLVALATIFLGRCGRGEEASPSSSQPSQMPVAPPQSLSIAAPAAAPESVPEPEPEPEAEPPRLAFTEEQTARLDALLAAWAEEETLVEPDTGDESGTKDKSAGESGELQLVPGGGHNVALWFLDMDSGAGYACNAQARFSYASLMKAPYALYLYQLAEAGELDLAGEITVAAVHAEEYKDNTGVLKDMDLPESFTAETLIGYMLRNSDTIAAKTLLQYWPAAGFRAWAAGLGLQDAQELRGVLSGQICAADAGLLMQALAAYVKDGQFGATLREHLLNTGNRMIASDWPVLHKYGWDEGAFHDMALIESPHPAILVILTDKWGGSWAERQMFGALTAELEACMAELRG